MQPKEIPAIVVFGDLQSEILLSRDLGNGEVQYFRIRYD